MLLTFLPLFTVSSVWLEPASPSTTSQAASWHSSLGPERSCWSGQAGTGTPWQVWTPDQHQGWLETRSLAELLDTGTTKHSTTCHKSSTDGYFKHPEDRHKLCALTCWLVPWVGDLAIQKVFQVVPAAKLMKLCIDQMSANSQHKLFLHMQMVT